MDNPEIKVKTVRYDVFVVESQNNICDIDDIINTLTILTSSEKDVTTIEKPEVANYLAAAKLIENVSDNSYKVVDKTKCEQLNDYLSNYMENIISKYSTPNVEINSSTVEIK